MKYRLPCLMVLLLFSCIVKAQQFVFNRVPLFEENVRGFITAMAQDEKGYMWFTGTSLYRYDGYHVTTFKHDPNNSNSLSASRLEFIYIDPQNIIWLGTFGSGLDRFDPATGIFSHYMLNDGDSSSLSNNIVTSIIQDDEGYLWVGTHGGLNRLDKKTGKFKRFQKNSADSTSLSNDQVRALYVDKKGVLWVGCGSPYNNETPEGEGGLNRYNKTTGNFTRYLSNPNDTKSLLDNKVRAMYEDSNGIFWVGTFGDGLHIMNRDKGTFTRYQYDPGQPEKLSSPQIKGNYHGVSFIGEDKNGGLWIGAFLAGLNYFDPKTSRLTRFNVEPENAKALGENTVWNAAFSREGVLWITTQSNVYRVDPLRKTIPHTATGGRVHAFYEDTAGIIWMTSDSGLIRSDTRTNTLKYFVNSVQDPGSINSNIVLSIYEDKKGSLWIGTDRGLNLLDKRTNKFSQHLHDAKNNNSISEGAILAMLEDSHGAFWLATDWGLDLMDRQTGSFKHYRHNNLDSNSLSSNAVYRLLEDRSGNLWVGTWGNGGLDLFNKNTGQFKHYLSGYNINVIYRDSENVIWAGTPSGLYRRNNAVDDFQLFNDPTSELGSANIVGIVEDEQKNLWIGSQSAIIKLNPGRTQTAVYGRKYGIIPNSSYDLTGYKTHNGELLFGDGTGYFSFFPKNILGNADSAQLQITDFKIGDISFKPGQAPLMKPIEETQEVSLNHRQGNFSLDFAAIHYSSIDENRHFFILEGYDEKWRKAGSEKTAAYFNVPPGSYIFKVKASSSDGVWTDKELVITITPPWWRTWWAYTLYFLLTAGLVWSIVYFRSRTLIKDKKLLEHKVQLRTSEIFRQKQEIEVQRDNIEQALLTLKSTQDQLVQREKMASLGELTSGIAHEIKNPLNFVNNFAEITGELLKEMGDQLEKRHFSEATALAAEVKQNLDRIMRHGKLADAIVQGMLQHSSSSNGKLELTDINAFTDEYLRLCYNRLKAKDKTFFTTLETYYATGLAKVNIVPGDIGRVLLNVIGNSFYAVGEKSKEFGDSYKPVVSISTTQINFPVETSASSLPGGNTGIQKGIEIRIKDNGTGIPQKFLSRIFQPFFTTKPAGQGTGLGLSLSYDIIVQGHGGRLNVETTEGEGAEFIIVLPVTG